MNHAVGIINVNFGVFKTQKFDKTYSKNAQEYYEHFGMRHMRVGEKIASQFTLVKIEYFHTNDV